MSRRRNSCGAAAACALVALLMAGAAAAQEPRPLGTCKPAPRANPERQAVAESLPLLPLPAVPLRRSEPNAEPAPVMMLAKLEYGTTEDWNTDPGDMDNLLRHVRYRMGLRYAGKSLPIGELVSEYTAGRKVSYPLLYISGHEAFNFSPEERGALRQYLLDGGTLFADACCGKDEFTASMRKEVAAMFPDRSFDLLDVDHPVYRAHYPYANVHFKGYDGGVPNDFQGPPQLLGMTLGCRTAVFLTPWDMSCGWDEHLHEYGNRLLPGDAIGLGVNLVSYVAAERPLAEAQSVPRVIEPPVEPLHHDVGFAQLRHQGDWNPDPNSVYELVRLVALESSLGVRFELKAVGATEADLAPNPFVFMTGHRDPKLTPAEVEALRKHLQTGGFLLINNCCGRDAFDRAVRDTAARLFPDQSLTPLPRDHAVWNAFRAVKPLHDRQTGAPVAAVLEGVSLHNRLVLVYSRLDMLSELKQGSDPYGAGYDAESCRALVLNVVAYALPH